MNIDVVHNTQNWILISHKKWNLSTYDNMNEPREYSAEWSQIEKDKYGMNSLICEVWKKKKPNDQIKQKRSHW